MKPQGSLADSPTARFYLASRQAEIRCLQELVKTCEVVTSICRLIHDLQRERGLTSLVLGSGGERMLEKRRAQVSLAQESACQLRLSLEQHYLSDQSPRASARLLSSVAYVFQGLDDLDHLRCQVDAGAIDVEQMIQALCRLIAGLLSVIFEAADSAGDPVVSRALVALLNFIQAKEYAGQERAWASLGYARGQFDDELKQRLRDLNSAQFQALLVFRQFSDAVFWSQWETLESEPFVAELSKLRRVFENLGSGEIISSELSEIWFDLASNRIDGMQDIELRLTDNLLAVSEGRVKEARQKLDQQRLKLDRMLAAGPSLLLDGDAPVVPGAVAPVTSPAGERMSRSIYDLLREQAEHLTQVSRQLDDARQALTERKLVERAKSLLMKNLGLGEDDAYRRIQQRAMSSNLRLSEVAQILIQAAEKAGAGRGKSG